jgi:ParB family chromosome partitioning protein
MKTLPLYCAACGKRLFRNHPTGRTPRYCFRTGACRQKAYRRRVKAKQRAKRQRDGLSHLLQESFEWYTPKKYLCAAREVLGEIELDPASSEQANRIVQAKLFYDQARDGLTQTWKARTVWLNPPYCKQGNTSNQDMWTAKLLAEYKAGNVKEALLLVTAATETTWFHRLYQFPMCFVKGRIQFTTPTGKRGGATKGSIFVYVGTKPERFRQVFDRFGVVK